MALPKSIKITKNGVEYMNNVDATQYTLKELIRAALRDSGKFICNRTRQKIKRKTGRLVKNIQYWVRSKQDTPDLWIGFRKGGFYGGYLELGTSTIPKLGALTETTRESIDTIQRIQAQYLSALSRDNPTIPSEDDYGDDA